MTSLFVVLLLATLAAVDHVFVRGDKAKHCELDRDCGTEGKANSCIKGLCKQVRMQKEVYFADKV